MSEKQFNITTDEDNLIVITNDGEIMTHYEVCDLLNTLHEENEQLQTRFKEERDTAMKLGSECDNLIIKNQKLKLEILRLEMIIKTGEKMIEKNERWIVNDAGTLIDMVTGETFDIVEEVVDILNYYENNCLRYQKIISEKTLEQLKQYSTINNVKLPSLLNIILSDWCNKHIKGNITETEYISADILDRIKFLEDEIDIYQKQLNKLSK